MLFGRITQQELKITVASNFKCAIKGSIIVQFASILRIRTTIWIFEYLHKFNVKCSKVNRRGCMTSSVLKHHIPFEKVPYSCSLYSFSCNNKKTSLNHVKKYSSHRDEEARFGQPGYTKVLRVASYLCQIVEEDNTNDATRRVSMLILFLTKWHLWNQHRSKPPSILLRPNYIKGYILRQEYLQYWCTNSHNHQIRYKTVTCSQPSIWLLNLFNIPVLTPSTIANVLGTINPYDIINNSNHDPGYWFNIYVSNALYYSILHIRYAKHFLFVWRNSN